MNEENNHLRGVSSANVKSLTKSVNSTNKQDEYIEKAKTLSEALPYMKKFSGETFIIKFGGSAMGDQKLLQNFAKDIVLLKQTGINPIVVHGGGPQIGATLKKMNIETEFVDGLRVTDKNTVDIVEMVLTGKINKQIVNAVCSAKGMAIGISGKDGNLIQAKKLKRIRKTDSNIEKILDMGFVGEPSMINPELFMLLEETDVIPIIAPIGFGENNETYNINADTVAGAIASALVAKKLIMLTDVEGLLDDKNNLVKRASVSDARKMISRGIVKGGMIPKVETCINAIYNNVEASHILDARIPHVLLLEIFTEHGSGTMIS